MNTPPRPTPPPHRLTSRFTLPAIDWPLAAVMIAIVVALAVLTALHVIDSSVLTHAIAVFAGVVTQSMGRSPGGGTMSLRPPPMPK